MPQVFFACYQMRVQAIGFLVSRGFRMKKLFAVVLMCSAVGAIAGPAPAKYQASCGACHSSGAAGAPKTHDVAAWQPRLEKGMPVLILSVRNGLGAMPPTGLCADCTDEEYTAMIEYMAAPAD
jgi:cytochrome c5